MASGSACLHGADVVDACLSALIKLAESDVGRQALSASGGVGVVDGYLRRTERSAATEDALRKARRLRSLLGGHSPEYP